MFDGTSRIAQRQNEALSFTVSEGVGRVTFLGVFGVDGGWRRLWGFAVVVMVVVLVWC